MKKYKQYDKDHLYDCPMCSDHALYVHDHRTVECKNCEMHGSIKTSNHKKELHVSIDGVMYTIEPSTQAEKEESICVVIDNELICVDKMSF